MKIKLLLMMVILAIGTTSTAYGQSGKKAEASAELAVGDAAPDFELATLGDETVTLSERFGDEGKPVILLFSRANW
jgi:cytochrome oxidase Cu insertion factor (SCO1/SenC/PrrC family)